MSALGITITEKRMNPDASCLRDEGFREFNKYAHRGYEVLLEWFE